MTSAPRILFFSEAVTLAHVVRPLALADGLRDQGYEVHFASAYRYEPLFNNLPLTYWPLESISYNAFINSVGGGASAYGDDQVETYLTEEDALIRDLQPDLIVSDTRLTLGISAPAAGVRLVNINNAYWSPYRQDRLNPVPAFQRSAIYHLFPKTMADRLMPYGVVKTVFPLVKPFIERQFLAPFNRARRRRKLPPFADFRTFYTWGDWTLYCDTPELVPLKDPPASHRFLGPLLWSPPTAAGLPTLTGDRPIVYVSFGSSNDVPRCREMVEELARMEVDLLVSTAGRFEMPETDRVKVAELFPGLEACRRASVVVCSGGSTAAYQALAAGRPVVGIPSNMDQYLSMGSIERRGAGISLRSDQVTPERLREAVERVLSDPGFRVRAEELAKSFERFDARDRFRKFLGETLTPRKEITRSAGDLQTVPGRWRRRAEASFGKPAFWGLLERQRGDPALSYGEVWERVQSLAVALRALGLERGERVGFLAAVGMGWELMHGAVLLAGGVVVGLDLHDAPERVRSAAEQSAVRAWVVESEEVAKERSSLFRGDTRFIVLLTGNGTAGSGNVVTLSDLLVRHPGKAWPEPDPAPTDLATLLFTSGTTGEPKGIAYTHSQLVHAVRAIVRVYRQLPEGFQSVCWLPLSNLFQRVVNLSAIERGAVITFVPHPSQLMESLTVVRPEVLIGVPRFYEKVEAGIQKTVEERGEWVHRLFGSAVRVNGWVRTKRQHGKGWPVILGPFLKVLDWVFFKRARESLGGRIQFMVSGSAPLGRRTLEFFWGMGVLVLEAYGLSENTVPVAVNRPTSFSFGTAGKPLAPNEVEVGEDREVLVKGPGVFGGYWRQVKDPTLFQGVAYRTGDEGEWREGGFLSLLGRRSDFIKTSTGRRISPALIEEAFKDLPFVAQAVALGNGRKGLAVLVTVDMDATELKTVEPGGGKTSTGQIQEYIEQALRECAMGLPEFSRPIGILVLDRAFSVLRGEMTANLKLRRRAIESNYAHALDDLYEESGPGPMRIQFVGLAESRMQEFRSLPKLGKIHTHWPMRWMRLGQLFLRGARHYGRYVADLIRRPWEYRELQGVLLERLVRDYRETVGPLKGPLVKIGQTLSYVDLGLPASLQKFLAELQEKSPPVNPREIGRAIQQSLGHRPEHLFAEWHETPLAAASISQIHLARLKDGRRVAVKVRYPGMERAVRTDLMAVRFMLPLISRMTGIENVRENYQEARRLFLGECDFRREAAFMERFRKIFAGHPRIGIPEVFPAYSSESVLTMEYVEGQNFAEFKSTSTEEERDQAGESIYEFFNLAALRHGLFHADPHPGNYLFQNGRVCILDFGFCKEWSKEFVALWKRQSRAVIANDLAEFTKATVAMGVRRLSGPFDYAALLSSYRLTVHSMNLEDRKFQFTKAFVLQETQGLLKHQIALNRVQSPPELFAFSRLFWGQHAVLSELGSRINCYRLTFPHLEG